MRTPRVSPRFPRHERDAVNVECPGVLFPPCPAERVDGRPDFDVLEPGFLKDPLPACARQAPDDSIRPEIDVANRRLGDRLAVGDVGKLDPPPGAEYPLNFREYPPLVGAEIDHAIADHHIRPSILDGKFLDQPFSKLHMVQSHL